MVKRGCPECRKAESLTGKQHIGVSCTIDSEMVATYMREHAWHSRLANPLATSNH